MPFLFSLVTLALLVVTLVDIIRRDDSQVKYLPKFFWIILAVLLPLIGSILWWALGREYSGSLSVPRPRVARPSTSAPAERIVSPPPGDTRSTEQQIADLDREIEEWKLREEIARRRAAGEDPAV